jgi:hypothetical protein
MRGDDQSQRSGARGGEGILDDASDPPSSSEEEGGPALFATILTDVNVQRATEILRGHGLVIIKGLLPPSQTVPWGDAAFADFNVAVCPPEESSYQTGGFDEPPHRGSSGRCR